MQEYLIYQKLQTAEKGALVTEYFQSDVAILRIAENLSFFGVKNCSKILDECSGSKSIIDRQTHARNIAEFLQKDKNKILLVHEKMKSFCTSKQAIFINEGEKCSISSLIDFVIENGYIRTGEVFDHGEFSVRGQIFDIATTYSFYRITFNGNLIETIYTFDQHSGLKEEKVFSAQIFPFSIE